MGCGGVDDDAPSPSFSFPLFKFSTTNPLRRMIALHWSFGLTLVLLGRFPCGLLL